MRLYTRDDTAGQLCKCCFAENTCVELHDHFGKCGHSYGHWLHINLAEGVYPLWSFLRDVPDAANPGLRDVAPLRMVSRFSCEASPKIQTVLEEMMACFIRVNPAPSEQIFAIGCKSLDLDPVHITTWDQLRDEIVQRVVIGGRRPPPREVVELMCSFLQAGLAQTGSLGHGVATNGSSQIPHTNSRRFTSISHR